MAADIENQLEETCELIQSSGGVFEVEDRNQLIFSKASLKRFPEDGEIIQIVRATTKGTPLADAQRDAAENAPHPPSFFDWFKGAFGNKKSDSH